MKLFNIKIPNEVINSLVIIIIGFLSYFIAKGFIKKILNLDIKNNKASQKRRQTVLLLIQRLLKYVIIIIVFISILGVFNINTTALVTSVSVISIVVGFGIQDVLKDYFVGISILIDDSFGIGDLIEVNGYKGEVIYFSLKTTKLKSLTGEIYIIANRQITEVTNYSINKKLLFIDICSRYEDDVNKVEEVLKDLCKRLSKEVDSIELVSLEDGIQELSDSSVIYRLSTLVNIKDIYKVKRKILEEVKKEFDKNNISIPYPQIEVHKNE